MYLKRRHFAAWRVSAITLNSFQKGLSDNVPDRIISPRSFLSVSLTKCGLKCSVCSEHKDCAGAFIRHHYSPVLEPSYS